MDTKKSSARLNRSRVDALWCACILIIETTSFHRALLLNPAQVPMGCPALHDPSSGVPRVAQVLLHEPGLGDAARKLPGERSGAGLPADAREKSVVQLIAEGHKTRTLPK